MSNNITIQATIHAPVTKVWERYTLPEHITHWNFASNDWCCPWAENDLRVGGKFTARMESKNGKMGFDFCGTYTDVKTNEHIAYAINGDGRKVDITFTPKEDAIEVVVTFEAESENSIELQRGGWQAILDNFKKYVEVDN